MQLADQHWSKPDITTRNRAIKKLLEQLWGRGKVCVFSGRGSIARLHVFVWVDHPDADTAVGRAHLRLAARREIRRAGINLFQDREGDTCISFQYWKDGVEYPLRDRLSADLGEENQRIIPEFDAARRRRSFRVVGARSTRRWGRWTR